MNNHCILLAAIDLYLKCLLIKGGILFMLNNVIECEFYWHVMGCALEMLY
jgi:hypothetical protein